MIQLSKEFGVCDNTVRKWLEKYDINIYDFGYRKLK